MATPTLRALRKHYGSDARLVGIHRPYLYDVLAGSNLLDESVEFAPKSKDRKLHTGSVIRSLRKKQLDVAVLLPNSLRTAAIAWAANIPRRIGYSRYGRGCLLTEKLLPPRDARRLVPISAVDYYLQLAKTLGADVSNRRLVLGTTVQKETMVDRIWERFSITHETVIALNTGGAYGAAKRWPEEHFAETARKISEKENAKVVVVCGPSERNAARKIQHLAKSEQVFSIADENLSLGLTKAIVRRCQMLITTDSGPRFFGTAFDIPTLTIFGPTDPRWSDPLHPFSENIRKDVPCGPCGQRVCPLGHHSCMTDLTPEFVVSAALNLLHRSRKAIAA